MTTASPFRRTARDVVHALRGTELDYTKISLKRGIFILSIPMMLEMSMEALFALVDVYFVTQLGSAATATVGVTEAVMTLLYALAFGLAMGTTAMVARRIGEKDPQAAGLAGVQALVIGLSISLVVSVVGVLGANTVLRMMGGTEEMVRIGTTYTAIIFAGNGTIVMIHLINAIFRGAGDATIAMLSLGLANAINIVLDPCLIFGLGPFPELGLTGAAVATTIGRGCGVAFQVALLFFGKSRLEIGWAQLRVAPRVLWRLLEVSAFGILQFLIATASWVGLIKIVGYFGPSALAGYTIAIRLVVLAFLPAWGMSNAVATLVGQNLGAKNPDRAERAVWLTARYNMTFLGSIGVVFIIFAPTLVGFFTEDAVVVATGIRCLRIVSAGFLFYAFGMVVVQAFNGAGDTVTPTKVNFVCFWLFQIPLAYTLALPFGLGPTGVFVSVAAAESLMSVLAGWLFRRGHWKTRTI